MSDIKIYHNPACGTSRNTLALIRNSGAEPEVILYLETPPSRERLIALLADMNMTPRALLRKRRALRRAAAGRRRLERRSTDRLHGATAAPDPIAPSW